MCNLYAYIMGQAAIRDIAGVMQEHDFSGNLPRMGGIYPDTPAPIVRNGPAGRELILARWGMPSPPGVLTTARDPGLTNVRNTKSGHWRRWLAAPAHRCIVPFTSFSEPETLADGKKSTAWFAFSSDRPVAFFAGIWTHWTGIRKIKEGEVSCDVFGFLTTEANAVVKPIHAKAMPVILRTRDEVDVWMSAPAAEALQLQRPLPDDQLMVVARGGRSDDPMAEPLP